MLMKCPHLVFACASHPRSVRPSTRVVATHTFPQVTAYEKGKEITRRKEKIPLKACPTYPRTQVPKYSPTSPIYEKQYKYISFCICRAAGIAKLRQQMGIRRFTCRAPTKKMQRSCIACSSLAHHRTSRPLIQTAISSHWSLQTFS